MVEQCNPILEMRGISKYFGHVVALEQVDFELFPNEILALLGDNGAGKSTLIKIISGVYPPDSGTIRLYGKEVQFKSPDEARKMGIETIYQDLALFDNLDVPANIFVGKEVSKKGLGKLLGIIDKKYMYQEAEKTLTKLGIDIDSYSSPVKEFSGGQRQSIAIAKTIYWSHKIVIMDEPTAALGVRETNRLFDLIRDLKKQGVSVILIMHNIEQVLQIAERAIVLKRGRRVGTKVITGHEDSCYDEIIRLLM